MSHPPPNRYCGCDERCGHLQSFVLRSAFLPGCIVVACPAIAQTQSEALPGYSVLSPGLPNQNFYCHAGYTLADCRQEVAELKTVLARYPTEELGPRTWVLVRSQDWIPISVLLGLKPESPAFTAVDHTSILSGATALVMGDFLRTAVSAENPRRGSLSRLAGRMCRSLSPLPAQEQGLPRRVLPSSR
jgi:hypothetical protein